MNLSAVPVIYYHSVKYKRIEDWVHPYITMQLRDFSRQVFFINALRLKTFFMDDLYYHLKGDAKLPINSAVLHFDDGYLDNFVFAFPLLKKYKLKATIWINPDFINDNDSRVRPTLDDYWAGKYSLEELNQLDGFFNWNEMRLMEKSGVVDIQSHTMSHAKYPISDKIIDFVTPSTKIDWLHWNLFPDEKPKFFLDKRKPIPLGFPIYESEKGNIAVKCEENGVISKEIANYVNQNGGEKFFRNPNWKSNLLEMADSLKAKHPESYKFETAQEHTDRLKGELINSKLKIEKKLAKKVNHLCWPFGGWNEHTEKLAIECGYLTTTIRGHKNIFRKKLFNRADRIALDNPKYQNLLFFPYALYKMYGYKF